MMDQRWFKLAVRFVGLLMVGVAISGMVSTVPVVWQYLYLRAPVGLPSEYKTYQYLLASSGVVGCATQAVLGVYMIFGAPHFVRWCMRRVLGRCMMCDYDVRGVTGGKCPECGWEVPGVSRSSEETKHEGVVVGRGEPNRLKE